MKTIYEFAVNKEGIVKENNSGDFKYKIIETYKIPKGKFTPKISLAHANCSSSGVTKSTHMGLACAKSSRL